MAAGSIFSVKTLSLSIGLLSMAVVTKLSLPTISSSLEHQIPLLYHSILAWLSPPYLYFVINGIIITIAASSRFQHKSEEVPESAPPAKGPAEITMVYDVPLEYEAVVVRNPAEIRPDYEAVKPEDAVAARKADAEVEEEEFVISRADYSLSRRESMEIPLEYAVAVTEKPLSSARFGHRKSVKASPEGSRILGVAKPKRSETLEQTWKTITEGRPMPLTRHLKKSETFEHHGRSRGDDTAATPVKKSETFKEYRATPSLSPSPASGKLRKEPSPSHDELNRRVEAFIKKFNEEMRLQRQESFKHYMDMVNRGSHY